ncbi:pentraxin-related protein PTX3 [Bombina bombina]|uniref:pentraxin-related protein PTX3 n=1 Tax=Bombina bombina TaxID=8345 RepID=UPI00235B1092|nr:pentraxin-related protein PTX3 [Bombina bombina]
MMTLKDTVALNLLFCAIWCFASALTIDDLLYVNFNNELENGIPQPDEDAVSDCQAKDLTKWDKLFTMLENSQMRENMLLQSLDEVIKVELQTLRGEMLDFVSNFAGTCATNIERATFKISESVDKTLDTRLQQAQEDGNSLRSLQAAQLEDQTLLIFNISNRLDNFDRLLQKRAESDLLQQNEGAAQCQAQVDRLTSAQNQIGELASQLKQTQAWISQRFLPSGCDAAVLFPMRSPKIYASVHPADMSLQAFTSCVWVKVTEALDRTIVFSYGTKRNPYEIQLYLDHNSAVLVVGGDKNKVIADNAFEQGQWSQLCGTWNSEDGNATLWVNGEKKAIVSEVAKGHAIPDRGIFQLGQEKNGCCVGGGFDESLSFSGKLTGFNLWDSVLDDAEIARTSNDCSIRGNIVGWGTTEVLPHGGALYIH